MSADWLIGSITIPAQAFTVNASGAVVPAGTYYLRHTTAGRSLIAAFAAAVVTAVGGTASATIYQNRLAHFGYSANRSVTWGAATQLRDLLGFAGNLGSADNHTATLVSPLLWSPGYPGTPKTIRGVAGYPIPHQAISNSDDKTESHTYHFGTETRQDIEWSHIVPERMRVATGLGGGTYHEFHLQSAMLGYRFLLYQDMNEDEDEASDASFTTQLGPYVLRPEARSGDWYRRNQPNAELSSPLALPLQLLSEYP
jgi:hypothetical protein